MSNSLRERPARYSQLSQDENEPAVADDPAAERKRRAARINSYVHSALWVAAAIFIIYYGDMYRVIRTDPRVEKYGRDSKAFVVIWVARAGFSCTWATPVSAFRSASSSTWSSCSRGNVSSRRTPVCGLTSLFAVQREIHDYMQASPNAVYATIIASLFTWLMCVRARAMVMSLRRLTQRDLLFAGSLSRSGRFGALSRR